MQTVKILHPRSTSNFDEGINSSETSAQIEFCFPTAYHFFIILLLIFLFVLGHADGITYIDSRGDGRHLISNSKDQSIKLWDVRIFSCDNAAENSLKAAKTQPWDYRWHQVPENRK